jgi:hypothetical protein
MKKQMALAIVHQHPKVLLGMKKRGFGAGRWNGFGGKVENDDAVDFKWVTLKEAKPYDLIDGIWEEIKQVEKILKKRIKINN